MPWEGSRRLVGRPPSDQRSRANVAIAPNEPVNARVRALCRRAPVVLEQRHRLRRLAVQLVQRSVRQHESDACHGDGAADRAQQVQIVLHVVRGK
jgi:hypothetical protein